MKYKRKSEQFQEGEDLEQISHKGREDPSSDDEEFLKDYIPYLPAKRLLEDRLNAAEEEIAMWCQLGPENGGLAAYLDPHIYKPLFRFSDSQRLGADYRVPLITCWFTAQDIETFQPKDRFMSSSRLIARWKSKQLGVKPEKFIKAMIDEGELFDLHPHPGRTQWRGDKQDFGREWAIFWVKQIKSIEAKNFPEDLPERKKELIATRKGVSAQRIMAAFPFWDEKRWKAVLSKPGLWLEDARMKPVVHRKAALWNPAEVANCLWAYRLKYWYADSNQSSSLFSRTIPPKGQLEKIIQENFPEWLKDWQPDLC